MLVIVSICTLLLLTSTLLPVSQHPHWIVRGMDFPRLQLAVLALLLLIAQSLLLDLSQGAAWLLLVITLSCLCWQLWWIAPYTPFWRVEVKAAQHSAAQDRLSIITVNVCTPNRNAEKLLALVNKHQPDVLVTLESDAWWQSQLDRVSSSMPYSIKCPLDNLYGMHVYSRLPLEAEEIAFLVEDDVPSMHCLLQLRNGDKVRMHFLHPAPPSPTENSESLQRDAELVIVARSVAGSEQPIVITGDLNDVAWSRTTRLFRKLSGLLDPRIGRGMFNTFHAKYPFLRWPLDHTFHSRHFTVHAIDRLPPIGSDHFGLLTQLVYTPLPGSAPATLTPDSTDITFARSLAKKQDVSASDVPQPGE
jgi:endonuclease/exonuclease/phosphatase (EEP) superfamily protein YafD